MLKCTKSFISLICIIGAAEAYAQKVTFNFTAQQNISNPAGTIEITETQYGLLFKPDLHDLTPGVHGFHVHQIADCGNNAVAAGEHFDPKKTKKHLGPYNDSGHLGDLPALYAAADGTVTLPVLAPRLKKISEINKRPLIIHSEDDNYSETPKPLGGSNERMACGIVK